MAVGFLPTPECFQPPLKIDTISLLPQLAKSCKTTSIAILKRQFSKNHSETVQKFAVRTTQQKSFERTAEMNEGKARKNVELIIWWFISMGVREREDPLGIWETARCKHIFINIFSISYINSVTRPIYFFLLLKAKLEKMILRSFARNKKFRDRNGSVTRAVGCRRAKS